MLRVTSLTAFLLALGRVPFATGGEHPGKVAFNNHCPNCHSSSARRPEARKSAAASWAIPPGTRWAAADAEERARLAGFLKSVAER